jgi:hypothetical protein
MTGDSKHIAMFFPVNSPMGVRQMAFTLSFAQADY